MTSQGFGPAVAEIKHLQIDALDRTAVGNVAVIIVTTDIIICWVH
jgi:hypothetical protein